MSTAHDTPLISVITPAYQARDTIARAVESVRCQTFSSWEMIVVDDGSLDDTGDVARQAAHCDPRIRVLRQPNGGTGAARNRGLAEARGRYVVFLDADDQLLRDYMTAQLAFSEQWPDAAIIGCNVIMRDDDKDSLWNGPEVREHSLSLDELLVDNTISVMALVRRDALGSVGGLRNVYAEDYDLWIRLLLAGYRHCHQPRILGVYHKLPTSKSANRSREWVAVARQMRDLVDDDRLTAAQRSIARETECRFRAMYSRVRMEQWLLQGEYRRARVASWITRRSYARLWKFVLAVCLTHVVPSAYRAWLRRQPSGYTAFAEDRLT